MKGRKPNLRIVPGGLPFTGKTARRIPPPLGGLCEPGAAEWKRVAPILHARGSLGSERLASLEAYCRAVGLSRTYTKLMDAEGHIVNGKTHPAFKMLMAATREARLFAVELGLTRTPAAPKREEEDNGWDADLLA